MSDEEPLAMQEDATAAAQSFPSKRAQKRLRKAERAEAARTQKRQKAEQRQQRAACASQPAPTIQGTS